MHAKALPGFRDFYPDDFALRAYIFAAWRDVAHRYAFEEYDGPPLEPLELYTAKSGEEIVGQLYAFEDKGGRQVALRPEMTPTLARMVAARANGLKKPIRWFSTPQLFRYERQQRGRLREHFQLNCDLIGEPGPLADAEVIGLAIDVMRRLGLGPSDVRVRLSDRRLLQALLEGGGIPPAAHGAAYQAVDKFERMSPDALAGYLGDQGVSAAGVERIREIATLRGRTAIGDAAARFGGAAAGDALARLDRVVAALEARGLGAFLDVDLGIVRGLAYYTGTVFELFDAGRSLRAICGGGRYDDLLAAVGGVDLPACGFGMGDVVLAELLKERGLVPGEANRLDVFVAAVGEEDLPEALGLVSELRDRGLRTEFPCGGQPVGKQVGLADARRARHVVVIGSEERARRAVVLKDLQTNAQRTVPRGEIVSLLAGAVTDARAAHSVHPPDASASQDAMHG